MDSAELLAYLVFASYFGLILFSAIFVGKSIVRDVQPSRLLEGRPFLFLRVAVAALGCTWYCEFAGCVVVGDLANKGQS